MKKSEWSTLPPAEQIKLCKREIKIITIFMCCFYPLIFALCSVIAIYGDWRIALAFAWAAVLGAFPGLHLPIKDGYKRKSKLAETLTDKDKKDITAVDWNQYTYDKQIKWYKKNRTIMFIILPFFVIAAVAVTLIYTSAPSRSTAVILGINIYIGYLMFASIADSNKMIALIKSKANSF